MKQSSNLLNQFTQNNIPTTFLNRFGSTASFWLNYPNIVNFNYAWINILDELGLANQDIIITEGPVESNRQVVNDNFPKGDGLYLTNEEANNKVKFLKLVIEQASFRIITNLPWKREQRLSFEMNLSKVLNKWLKPVSEYCFSSISDKERGTLSKNDFWFSPIGKEILNGFLNYSNIESGSILSNIAPNYGILNLNSKFIDTKLGAHTPGRDVIVAVRDINTEGENKDTISGLLEATFGKTWLPDKVRFIESNQTPSSIKWGDTKPFESLNVKGFDKQFVQEILMIEEIIEENEIEEEDSEVDEEEESFNSSFFFFNWILTLIKRGKTDPSANPEKANMIVASLLKNPFSGVIMSFKGKAFDKVLKIRNDDKNKPFAKKLGVPIKINLKKEDKIELLKFYFETSQVPYAPILPYMKVNLQVDENATAEFIFGEFSSANSSYLLDRFLESKVPELSEGNIQVFGQGMAEPPKSGIIYTVPFSLYYDDNKIAMPNFLVKQKYCEEILNEETRTNLQELFLDRALPMEYTGIHKSVIGRYNYPDTNIDSHKQTYPMPFNGEFKPLPVTPVKPKAVQKKPVRVTPPKKENPEPQSVKDDEKMDIDENQPESKKTQGERKEGSNEESSKKSNKFKNKEFIKTTLTKVNEGILISLLDLYGETRGFKSQLIRNLKSLDVNSTRQLKIGKISTALRTAIKGTLSVTNLIKLIQSNSLNSQLSMVIRDHIGSKPEWLNGPIQDFITKDNINACIDSFRVTVMHWNDLPLDIKFVTRETNLEIDIESLKQKIHGKMAGSLIKEGLKNLIAFNIDVGRQLYNLSQVEFIKILKSHRFLTNLKSYSLDNSSFVTASREILVRTLQLVLQNKKIFIVSRGTNTRAYGKVDYSVMLSKPVEKAENPPQDKKPPQEKKENVQKKQTVPRRTAQVQEKSEQRQTKTIVNPKPQPVENNDSIESQVSKQVNGMLEKQLLKLITTLQTKIDEGADVQKLVKKAIIIAEKLHMKTATMGLNALLEIIMIQEEADDLNN